jgi:hypothetical protein
MHTTNTLTGKSQSRKSLTRIKAVGITLVAICSFTFLHFPSTTLAQDSGSEKSAATKPAEDSIDSFLIEGRLSDAEKFARAKLSENPNDDQSRYGLGVVQFMQSIERLGQAMYEYQPRDRYTNWIPFVRFPVPKNDSPAEVSLEDLRQLIQKVADDLQAADETLSQIKSEDVKLPLHLLNLHIDFNKNGKIDEQEDLTETYRRYLSIPANSDDAAKKTIRETVVVFDRSDVEWMRGYTCLLRAMCEMFLAYDHSEMWDVGGRLLFEKGETQYQWQEEEYIDRSTGSWQTPDFLDIIAMVHNARFKLSEPDRLKKAHELLLRTIQHSREMWKLVKAETDNDREWIPGPSQNSAITRARVNNEMIGAWEDFLIEAEKILNGETLVPFWRGKDPKRGVNIKKVFHEPRDLDLVLWVQGSGAVSYVQEGENITSPAMWRRLQRTFGGDFIGFAIWFN